MKPGLEVLILAGGGGTRLWPLSRRSVPKPLLPLAGGVSPLRRTMALARRIAGPRGAWVVCGRSIARRVRAHLRGAGPARLIVEPAPRNTAAALALGSEVARSRIGAEWVLGLPADQWIRWPARFAKLVRQIIATPNGGWLVTFGVRASFPHPGYGYIEVGEPISGALHAARRFVEKPDTSRAGRYLRSGRWLWNSGMFLWKAEVLRREVRRLLPALARAVEGLLGRSTARRRQALALWQRLPSVSFDHAVMERASRVAVAPCEVGWTDLGSWEAVAQSLPRAADGSPHRGAYVSLDGRNCLIYTPEHLTVNLGVRRVGLVATRDAILLFDPDQHQRVREVVERLRRERALARFV